jgi:hypothetical protein
MNCKNCNNLLEQQTRVCARCGMPVQENTMVSGADQTTRPAPPTWPQSIDATTPQQPLVLNAQPLSPQASSYPPQEQLSSFAPTTALSRNGKVEEGTRARRRNLGGCFSRLILVVVLLCAALAGAWFFVLQPTVHAAVLNKLDNAMTQAVDKIPSVPNVPNLPPRLRSHLPTPNLQFSLQDRALETMLENILKLNMAPSDPVQDPVVHVNQQGVRLELNIHPSFLPFSFPCAVSFLPVIDAQGNLVAQNTQIEGIARLALSPDDLTTLLNKHFADAINKLNHPISSLNWTQDTVEVTLK